MDNEDEPYERREDGFELVLWRCVLTSRRRAAMLCRPHSRAGAKALLKKSYKLKTKPKPKEDEDKGDDRAKEDHDDDSADASRSRTLKELDGSLVGSTLLYNSDLFSSRVIDEGYWS